MSDSESDDEMGKDTGLYPRKELWIARRNFLISWMTAVHRNPTINAIHEAHRRFPPKIRMRNCLEYPFYDDGHPKLMPRRIGNPYCLDSNRGPVSQKRKRYRSVDLYCDFLTKQIEATPVKPIVRKCGEPTKNSTYFTCDNCPYKSVIENEARRHLTSSSHRSCSKYSFGENNDEEDTHASVLLCPRIISNELSTQALGWRRRDITVVCPVCDLILPDKILCGYHHQIHHPGHQAQCSFGEVLAIRDVVIYKNHFCSQCNRSFSSMHSFVDHWYTSGSWCSSPFLLTPLRGEEAQLPPNHVIEMHCLTCGTHIDRATSSIVDGKYKLPKNRKRKRGRTIDSTPSQPGPVEQLIRWTDGWSRLCVNHAYLHFYRSGNLARSCVLRIRFVRIDKTKVHTVPPFVHQSDEALLRFCLAECKGLLNYLEHFLTARRALFRQTKLAFNELRLMTGMDSRYSKINPQVSTSALARNAEQPLEQLEHSQFFMV